LIILSEELQTAYVYTPISLIVAINVILYAMTTYNLYLLKSDISSNFKKCGEENGKKMKSL
jgi:hypothetical protein